MLAGESICPYETDMGSKMTPLKHCQLSQQRRGGDVSDYLRIHEFIDSTKMLCADNRHRILHNHWALDSIFLPLFGREFHNSEGKRVYVKEMIEQDHFLPDYKNRFIPTLGDFVQAIEVDDIETLQMEIEGFHGRHCSAEFSKLMLSPLYITGKFASLLFTHNSWFVGSVLPLLNLQPPEIIQFSISPSDIFDRMKHELWMDNGAAMPPSAQHG